MRPTNKVTAGALAGALSVILVYVLNTYVLTPPLSGEVASALTVLLTFVTGYLVPEGGS